MINYDILYENTILFDKLLDLLEQDRTEIAGCLQGELLKEYQNYLDLEIKKVQELKKLISNALV